MADIRPFLCIRPREDEAAEIAALPYDVYNREEAKKAVEGHDKSFLRIDRAETQFDDSVDTYAPEVYKKAHDMLWDMVAEGDFVKEEKTCYYIYELTLPVHVQRQHNRHCCVAKCRNRHSSRDEASRPFLPPGRPRRSSAGSSGSYTPLGYPLPHPPLERALPR